VKCRKYIITGGPGMGKTSLIDALRAEGYPVFDELARQIIKEEQEKQSNNLPWIDYNGFSNLIFERMQRQFHKTEEHTISFYDRGIPDILGYLRWKGLPEPGFYKEAIQEYGYHTTVFVTPPWQDIYATDDERKESFEESKDLYDNLTAVYREMNFKLVELPKVSVADRLDIILKELHLQERPSSSSQLV